MKHLKFIFLFFVVYFFNNTNCISQNKSILLKCKILAIDTLKTMPNCYLIKAKTSQGNILILSQNKEKTINVKNIININKEYELELFELDSIKLLQNDNSWKIFNFADIGHVRGSEIVMRQYFKGEKSFIFEIPNDILFGTSNLNGLEYIKINNN